MDTFEIIYRKYYRDVFHFHMKHTSYNQAVAEELTQETFFQAYRSIGKFDGKSHVKTWLIAIGKNVYKAYLRKKKDHLPVSQCMIEDQLTSQMEERFVKDEMMTSALQLIGNFPEKMSKVMLLRIVEEKSYSQICEDLSITMSSAKVLFHRGKVMLQKKLKEVYGYEI